MYLRPKNRSGGLHTQCRSTPKELTELYDTRQNHNRLGRFLPWIISSIIIYTGSLVEHTPRSLTRLGWDSIFILSASLRNSTWEERKRIKEWTNVYVDGSQSSPRNECQFSWDRERSCHTHLLGACKRTVAKSLNIFVVKQFEPWSQISFNFDLNFIWVTISPYIFFLFFILG